MAEVISHFVLNLAYVIALRLARHFLSVSDGVYYHICHFFYTGRIFESQYFTPKNYKKRHCPQKCKICSFLHSIWKILHRTESFTKAPPVVPVTNMRYVLDATVQTWPTCYICYIVHIVLHNKVYIIYILHNTWCRSPDLPHFLHTVHCTTHQNIHYIHFT